MERKRERRRKKSLGMLAPLLNPLYFRIFFFKIYFIGYTIIFVPFFLPFTPLCPVPPFHQHPLPLSSCPWVIHISSLASPFPTLFLTSPCLFCTYQLCFLLPVPLLLFSPIPLPIGKSSM